MNNPLGVSPSKGNQIITRGKENIQHSFTFILLNSTTNLIPNRIKLYLNYKSKYYFARTNLLVIQNTYLKNFWIWINPRFSVPRRNLKNISKTPPFCFATEFEENGSSGCCDFYPGRSNTVYPGISARGAYFYRRRRGGRLFEGTLIRM